MGNNFGLGTRLLGLLAQQFGSSAVQHLTAALEQAVVGRVPDQRVLEAIARLRRNALDKQEVSVGEPIQRRLQRRLVQFGNLAHEGVCEIAPKDRANLCDLTRSAQPIEPRGKGLLQGRRNGLNTALLATFNKQARHLLNEQRHAAGALADPFDNLLR